MRLLVVGGMHGNEPLGLRVVDLLERQPIPGVDVARANELAIAADCRFIGQDLNRSFPGDSESDVYELSRAAQLLSLAKQYDVVLDFHNTYCPENDCGFVGDTASPRLYGVAGELGLHKIIVADYDCVNKYASNCLSVEISIDSPLNRSDVWYERIRRLSEAGGVDTFPAIERYRFVYRMTLEDKQRLKLDDQSLGAFQPISNELARAMGVAAPAYPIFIGDKFTPYNYGGILNRIE